MGSRFKAIRSLAGVLPLLLACLLLHPIAATAADVDVKSLPKPTGYVSDLAHVVNEDSKQKLEEFCTRVEQQLGVQLALVTIDSIGDTPIENFSLDLARTWGVGAKKDNSGVLLLLVVKSRKSRVEVGRGVEPYVTDGLAGSTLRSMRPQLRAGDYGAALLEGAREIASEIAQGKGVNFDEGTLPPRQRPEAAPRPRSSFGGIITTIVILLVFFLLFRGGRRGGGGGGFWLGFLLSSLLSGGRNDRGGGGWGGGGFGGDSGGGGGFGGFGGGDFGGGGASSDW